MSVRLVKSPDWQDQKERPEAMQIGVLSLQATSVTRRCGERLVVYFKAARIVIQDAHAYKRKNRRRRRSMTKAKTRIRTKKPPTSILSTNRLFALHINSTKFVEERTRYLEDLLKRGWSKNTVQGTAYKIAAFAGRVDITCEGGVTLGQVQDAADDWMSRATHTFVGEIGPHRARTKFISNARNWLQFLNRYREPDRTLPYSNLVLEYGAFLDQARQLSPLSIQKRSWDIQNFLNWYELQNRPIKEVTLNDVDRYFAFPRSRRLSRVTISGRATSLRSFFRYLEIRKLCPAHIASAIDGPRVYKHELLPRGPSWQEVQRLIASIGTVRAGDIRDRAMVILLAMYGFRSGEVCRLQLDNINWQKEEILLTHSKRPNHRLYPLMREAGDAILLYLQTARPKSHSREIFLHAQPPFKALTTAALGTMVRNRMKALGFTLPHYGPHALRHSCATHLLAEGVSLKVIGDLLGHVSAISTQVYAKVDLKGLREVARLDMGDLI